MLAGEGEEDDAWVNVARVLYIALLSTHFALCLTMGRASWARAMRVVGLNPFRGAAAQRRGEGQIRLEDGEGGDGGGEPSPRLCFRYACIDLNLRGLPVCARAGAIGTEGLGAEGGDMASRLRATTKTTWTIVTFQWPNLSSLFL